MHGSWFSSCGARSKGLNGGLGVSGFDAKGPGCLEGETFHASLLKSADRDQHEQR